MIATVDCCKEFWRDEEVGRIFVVVVNLFCGGYSLLTSCQLYPIFKNNLKSEYVWRRTPCFQWSTVYGIQINRKCWAVLLVYPLHQLRGAVPKRRISNGTPPPRQEATSWPHLVISTIELGLFGDPQKYQSMATIKGAASDLEQVSRAVYRAAVTTGGLPIFCRVYPIHGRCE